MSARADDRDRGRGQHVPQARHAGGPFPFGDRVAVGAEGGVGLAGGQREREVVHTVGQGAVHRQPGVGEHLQHERVLAERLRGESVDSPAAGQRDQVLQQQRANAAAVHLVGDRHGDLSGPGAIAENLIAAASDHFPAQHSQQRGVIRCRLTADPARLLLGRKRADAEETQIEIVRGHPGVHVPHRLEVARPRGPDLDRRAVGQQSVGAGLGPCAHVALPGISVLPQGLFSRSLICRRGQQTGPRCGVPRTRSSASVGLRASRSTLEYGSTAYDTPARPRPIRCRDRYRHRPRPPGSSDVLHFQPSLRAPGQPGTKGPHLPARGSAEIDSLWERTHRIPHRRFRHSQVPARPARRLSHGREGRMAENGHAWCGLLRRADITSEAARAADITGRLGIPLERPRDSRPHLRGRRDDWEMPNVDQARRREDLIQDAERALPQPEEVQAHGLTG